ncbi:MAG: baseplate J/gp47 family protein [Deltaproteobacteria bacterium]|nr:baseplate J/gp47 family protein [Deltaproteobacteria bacterium]
MPLLPPSVDYTDKDFDALRERLIALLQSVFPEWSDFAVAGFGNILLEMYAFVGDVITYYLDAQARESRLATATQRKNVIALARMLGFRLQGARAAKATVQFSLQAPPSANVALQAGTVVRTQEVTEPVRFQLLAPLVIAAGTSPPVASAVVEHSETHSQLFDSRGLAGLDLLLDRTPYLDGSASISASNGAYTEVDSLLGSGPNDRHFLVLVDQNDRAMIRFGNGVNGAPPSGTISVTYKTGGGAAGNVDAGRLVVVEGSFADAHGRPVRLMVTNPAPAQGGSDRQSIASAKLLAPESLRALTRTVSREDFEINARRVPGVSRALMLTSNEDTTIQENCGVLFVIPKGGGLPTPALKNLVLKQVTEVYPCTLTFQVSVQDPVYRTVDVEARVFLRQGASPGDARDRIRKRLAEMFRIELSDGTPNPDIDFGFNVRDAEGNPAGEIAWSDVFNIIRDTDGVRKLGDGPFDLKLNGLPSDVKLGLKEFPVLRMITLFDGDTGVIL